MAISEVRESAESTDRLAELRIRMTAVTDKLIEVLSERGDIGLEIGAEKALLGVPQVRDKVRERQLLDHITETNPGPYSSEALRRVLQVVMDVTSELQAEHAGLPLGDHVHEIPGASDVAEATVRA